MLPSSCELILAALCFASVIWRAYSWGHVGHEITAAIAQGFLTPISNQTSSLILSQDDHLLKNVAAWADRIKWSSHWRWTRPLHFVNTPSWSCSYESQIDCANDKCCVAAVSNYTTRLMHSKKPDDIYLALKFLIHYVGDVHQPLHIGFKADEGGNREHGRFCTRKCNLHSVWDEEILHKRIDDFKRDQNAYAAYLLHQTRTTLSHQTMKWISCVKHSNVDVRYCCSQWAGESAKLACTNAYKYTNGTDIGDGFYLCDDYYAQNIGVVEMQLIKGGVRLAALLNYVWSSSINMLPNNHYNVATQ